MDAQADLFSKTPFANNPHSDGIWRPIHYLGSKLRVIGPICDLLDEVDSSRRPVCDLFAGSGTVAFALAQTRAVTTVDIQEYSRILCSALLNPANFSSDATQRLCNRVRDSQLREQLFWAAEALVEHEERALGRCSEDDRSAICDIIEDGSLVKYQRCEKRPLSDKLTKALRQSHNRLNRLGLNVGPKAVPLRHFGGAYFSYSQAIDISVLLDIANEYEGKFRTTLSAATLSTASELVNSVGKQFAQPLRPRGSDGKPKLHLFRKIVHERRVETFDVFAMWLEKYRSLRQSNRRHRSFRADYEVALTRYCDDIGVVYADPPYTRDHYSRFYHALETMCLRDDPELSATHSGEKSVGRGIYRADRHQSPFCIMSQAPLAFAQLFKGVRRLGVPLVLSYSPLAATTKPRPRVVETDDLLRLASRYFNQVEIVTAGRISHSKLNRTELNSETSDNAELFMVCT